MTNTRTICFSSSATCVAIRFAIVLASICISISAKAQDYYVPDGYVGYYDYDHRVIVRATVECDEDYHDLWNGCYVRVRGNYSYVYYGNSQVVYGTRVRLAHTGQYMVQINNGYWRLYDEDGDYTGAWGDSIYPLWNGNYLIKVGGYWKLYDSDGDYMGLWGDDIDIFWNGCYIVLIGNTYKVYDDDCDYTGVWGDDISLTYNGNYRVTRGNSVYYFDSDGDRIN